MGKEEETKNEEQGSNVGLWVKVGALIGLALVLTYGKLVWPFIHGRMVKENISFLEAASSEHILIGGLVGLVVVVASAWLWAERN